jgi:MscS family membrane protein
MFKFRYLICIPILLFSVKLAAQIEDSLVQKSPYTVIYNHLYYLQEEQYEPDKASLSLPPDTKQASQKAIKLKQILDGKGLFVDINRIPQNPAFRDTTSKESIYFIDAKEPLIYVERIDGNWYYSRTTVNSIEMLHSKVYPFGASLSTYFTSPTWDNKFLGIKLWKGVGALIMFVFTILLVALINWILKKIVRIILKRKLGIVIEFEDNVIYLSRLASLYLGVRFLLYLLPALELPIKLQSILVKGLIILSIFFVLFIAVQIIKVLFKYFARMAQNTESTLDDQLMPVLQRIVIIVVWIFGTFYVFDYLGVNVTALLAGISIGGLAIALAAQDTVKNFFGSIMIFVDKPFQMGDAIQFGDVTGVVEEVGVRSTRIRTFQNSLTYVPNGMLADKVVDNLGLRQFRRFTTSIGVTYDTPPKKIDLFVKGIRQIIMAHPLTKKDGFEVHLNDFAASSVNILVYMFFAAKTWTEELESRHQILYAIKVLAADLEIDFAFPTQSIHIESNPDKSILSMKGSSKEYNEDDVKNSLDNIRKYFDTGENG